MSRKSLDDFHTLYFSIQDNSARMTDTGTLADYSWKHEFLGSLQGSDGEHQLSEDQVDDIQLIGLLSILFTQLNTFC